MKDAIRLTNRTAIALRRSAQRMRAVHIAVVAVITAALAAAAVYWGLRWLPAVPLTLGAAALMDALLLVHARSSYLRMISQAICTEAAAREIRAGGAQAQRREQAIADLMRAKADLYSGKAPGAGGSEPFFEAAHAPELDAPEDELDEPAPQPVRADMDEQAPRGDAPVHRRRRQPAASLQIIRNQQAK
ncbi:MAG: hypothetical protein ACI4PG_11280 [Candidatus Ventricola sp.]